MEFLSNTSAWIKGEIFEAKLIVAFGVIVIIIAAICWKFGVTPNAKGLVISLFAAGLIYTSLGVSMLVSNQKRKIVCSDKYAKNQHQFVLAEKTRVEGFQYMYLISKIVATVFFTATLLIFWFSRSSLLQGCGIGMSVFAIAGLVIDHFSQERAEFYYQAILKALQ